MPIRYSYDPARRLLEASVTGAVSIAEVREYFDKVERESWFPAAALTDLREAEPTMPSDDVRTAAHWLRDMGPKLRRVPLAVLVASDVEYGLVRMIQQLQEDAVLVRPFRDRKEALDWIDTTLARPTT